MSWDAYLTQDTDDGPTTVAEWNYTSNVSKSLRAAALDAGLIGGLDRWWDRLVGKSGPDGALFLHRLLTQLRVAPEGYALGDPSNGWGSVADVQRVLQAMIDVGADRPLATWTVVA